MSDPAAQQLAPPTRTWSQLSGQGALRRHHVQSPIPDPVFAYGVATVVLTQVVVIVTNTHHGVLLAAA